MLTRSVLVLVSLPRNLIGYVIDPPAYGPLISDTCGIEQNGMTFQCIRESIQETDMLL